MMSKYTNLEYIDKNKDKNPYGENQTDNEYLQEEIPKFDCSTNMWVIDTLGVGYECKTMKHFSYPNIALS